MILIVGSGGEKRKTNERYTTDRENSETIRNLSKEPNKKKRCGRKSLRALILAGALGLGTTAISAGLKDNTQGASAYIPRGEQLESTIETAKETIETKKILEQIVNGYNEKHPETPISAKDIGIILTYPEYLVKQTNEDGSTQYIQNYEITGNLLQENQKFVYKDDHLRGGYSTDGVCTLVNKINNEIIGLSIGKFDNFDNKDQYKYEYVYTVALQLDGKYYEAYDYGDFVIKFENEDEKRNVYEKLKEEALRRASEQEEQEKQEKLLDEGYEPDR